MLCELSVNAGGSSPALVSWEWEAELNVGLLALWTFTELYHYDLCSSLFVL